MVENLGWILSGLAIVAIFCYNIVVIARGILLNLYGIRGVVKNVYWVIKPINIPILLFEIHQTNGRVFFAALYDPTTSERRIVKGVRIRFWPSPMPVWGLSVPVGAINYDGTLVKGTNVETHYAL